MFAAHCGLVVRDARSQVYAGCVHLPACRAPHHEGLRPHPEERAFARVSKDEATKLENAPGVVSELYPLLVPANAGTTGET